MRHALLIPEEETMTDATSIKLPEPHSTETMIQITSASTRTCHMKDQKSMLLMMAYQLMELSRLCQLKKDWKIILANSWVQELESTCGMRPVKETIGNSTSYQDSPMFTQSHKERATLDFTYLLVEMMLI